MPPVSYTTRERYTVLETGANDATGECTGVYAENSHAITYDEGTGNVDGNGDYIQRTSESDLPQTLTDIDDTDLRQVINNGKLYSFPRFVKGVNFGPQQTLPIKLANLHGWFYVPASSLFDLTYSKTFDYSVGCDYYGDLNSEVQPDYPVTWFADFGIPFGESGAKLFVGSSPGVAIKDQQMGLLGDGFSFDAGLSFSQFALTGFQLRVAQSFTKFESIAGSTDFAIEGINTFTNLATGQELGQVEFSRNLPRCYRPSVGVTAPNLVKRQLVQNDFTNFQLGSTINTQWRYDIRLDANDDPVTYSAGWINKLAVDNDLTDTATFRCLSFKGYRSDGSLFKEVYPDPGEFSLTHNQIIDIDARVGDEYVVAFDNMGNHTTEVTNVTFNLPMVSAVDRTTESFTAYEFNTFTFDGPVFGGIFPPGSSTSNLTFTHDQSGNDITSPFTLQLRSINGIQE